MKRKVEQLRNGKFEYTVPRLILSQDRIYVQLKPGEKLQDELYFSAENNEKITGYVNTSNRRFVPSMEKFSGTDIQFVYGIDAGGMKPGEISRGILSLITNVGEYEIPFIIEAEREQMRTSMGEVADMDAFVRLASENKREAFRLFTSPAFVSLLEPGDRKLLALYQGLTQNPVTYQHLEEFLIGTGKKQQVQISLKEEGQEYYEVTESVQETMSIFRSGWGHLQLEVETRGDFVETQKKTISEDGFIGSVYQLQFVIHYEKLGRGKNFGSIVIKSPYEKLEYQITASKSSRLSVSIHGVEKQKKAMLFQDFVQMQLGQLDFEKWRDHGFAILKSMAAEGCDYPIYQIYEAYIYHRDDQEEKAKEILLRYQDKSFTRQDIELAGAYLYVCYETGILTDRWNMVDKLQQLYRQQQESYLLLWILMHVDEEYKGSPLRSASALEHQYEIGCRSPLMYLEGYRLVEKEMNLLNRMTPFWTQVMLYGARQQLLSEEISMRIAYLSGYEKSFSNSLYQTLTLAYAEYPSNDTLEAICKLAMKDTPGKKKYFPWFERAVEENLRLTRLYECYVEAIDGQYQKILPRSIRIYFVYNNSLSDNKKAFVYANVVRHKNEDRFTYENYRRIVYSFACRKLQEGAISEDYAVLYQELADNGIEEEWAVEALSQVAFTNRLYCDDSKIRNVIVRHSQMAKEEVYPCVKGVAYPKIYTEDAVILFQDNRQLRYVATVDYNLRRLFDEEEVERCEPDGNLNEGFLLYRCSDKNSQGKVSRENLDAHQQLTQCDAFTREFCQEARKRLLTYYGEHARGEEIDDYLKGLDYVEFARVDKAQLMELLIERGMLKEAYLVLSDFGYEGVSYQALLKLCSRMILRYEFEEDDELLCLAYDVFSHGLYDEVLLHYLMLYYVGPVETMFKLWYGAVGFEMDTYRLEEKILTQLMFVGDYRPGGSRILENYVKQKGQEEVVLAYISFLSYGYFVHGQQMTSCVQQCLERAYEEHVQMDMICKVSLLQLYCQKSSWTPEQEETVKRLLEECGHRQLRFSFFGNVPGELLTPYQLDDKVFAEICTNPEAKVMIYYGLDSGLGQENSQEKYQCEPLYNMYQGYFNKTFTLFYGETLHYYFQVEEEGRVYRTPKKVLTARMAEGEVQTRYQMINQILTARKTGKSETAREKMRQYLQQERLMEHLFTIEKDD